MIYGSDFNLIHFPKTGGTWIRRVCEKLGIPSHPRHLPYSRIPEDRVGFPTYCLVRNPWDWYVSLWGHRNRNVRLRQHEFQLPYHQLDAFHQKVYDRFSGDFEQSMRVMSGWEPWEEEMGVPLRWMSDRFFFLTEPPKGAPEVQVFRYEDTSPEELLQMLLPDSDAIRHQLLSMPKQNVGDRDRDFRIYYTPELFSLVKEHDRELIQRFNYQFDQPT